VHPLVVLSTALVILIAELPDKSMFVVLVLGTRFARLPVAIGAAVAFVVHVAIAVLGGRLISLLPHRASAAILAVLFAAGVVWLLRMHDDDDELEHEEREAEKRVGADRSALRVASVTFGFVFLSEWGDITQLATASMAARPGAALSVAIGASIGLWAAVALAVTVGGVLLRKLPPLLFHRIAATALAVFAVLSVVSFIRG
jgi:putative Ca2+/H+ antiporter (TMEM165/GDT1 family)